MSWLFSECPEGIFLEKIMAGLQGVVSQCLPHRRNWIRWVHNSLGGLVGRWFSFNKFGWWIFRWTSRSFLRGIGDTWTKKITSGVGFCSSSVCWASTRWSSFCMLVSGVPSQHSLSYESLETWYHDVLWISHERKVQQIHQRNKVRRHKMK